MIILLLTELYRNQEDSVQYVIDVLKYHTISDINYTRNTVWYVCYYKSYIISNSHCNYILTKILQ